MAGVLEELQRINFGKSLADNLANIGQMIKSSKQEDAARQIINQEIPRLLTGDISSQDFRTEFARIIGQSVGLGQPGQEVREATQIGVLGPLQVQQQLETQKLARAKTLGESFNKGVESYMIRLATPGSTPESLKSLHDSLLQQRNALLPQVQGYENTLLNVPDPVPLREMGTSQRFQQKGVTEKGSFPVGYDTARNMDMVTKPDGTSKPYTVEEFGRIIQTAMPYSSLQLQQSFTPDAVELSARTFIQTGQMPLGMMGNQARGAILNKAAELLKTAGLSLDAVPAIRAEYDALKGSLASVEKQYNMVMTFEKTAERNLQIALQQSGLVDRWDSPLLNKVKLYFQGQIGGDKDIFAFTAAVHVAANEIAKVTSTTTGNMVPEQERIEYQKLISTALSMPAFKSVTDILRADMESRRVGYNSQIKEIHDQLKRPFLQDLENQATEEWQTTPDGFKFRIKK